MSTHSFMDKFRSFFGISPEPPRNDFRNPIWGSDDDDDEGDELYTRHQIDVYNDPIEIHKEFTRQMHDALRTFGTMFGDVKSFFDDNFQTHSFTMTDDMAPEQGDNFNSNNIRDYYLKPGYHSKSNHNMQREDIDLDGKISSNEISGLLKQKDDLENIKSLTPFSGIIKPGKSFCQTVITTSVTKPDGTVETRRIVKNGNEVIEETTTTIGGSNNSMSPINSGLNSFSNPGIIFPELSSLFSNFY